MFWMLLYNPRWEGDIFLHSQGAISCTLGAPCTIKWDGQSIFICLLIRSWYPLYVQEEDLYTVFASDNPELGVEAIRVPRDPKTSIGKGFGFVLFKTKVMIKKSLRPSVSPVFALWVLGKRGEDHFRKVGSFYLSLYLKFCLTEVHCLFGSKFASQSEDSVCISWRLSISCVACCLLHLYNSWEGQFVQS